MCRSFSSNLVVAMLVAGAASAGTLPAPSAPPKIAAADKIRCKRYVETGSLARVREECHTAAVWQQLALIGRRNAMTMLDNTVQSGSHISDDP